LKTGFIDWTENNLHFYLLDKQGGQIRILDSHSVPIDEELNPSLLTSFIKVKTDEIYLSLPLDLLTLREISFPFSDRSKISNTISYELEGILIGNTNDYSIDHIVIESTDGSSKVLAACIEKKKLQEIIGMLSALDLEPKVITSLDLQLSGGDSNKLFDEAVSDKESRAAAALQELLNPSINLRQDELFYQGDIERLKKKLRLTAVLSIIILIILSTSSGLSFINLNKEQKSLNNKIESIYRGVFPEDKKIVDVGRQFKGKMNTLIKKKEALAGIPVLDILRNIAVKKDRKITLHGFNSDGKNLIIKGAAKSFEDVESFKNTLATEFKGVKVMDSETSADKQIIFSIIMQEKTA
jgi:type II secretory pathway component PulL